MCETAPQYEQNAMSDLQLVGIGRLPTIEDAVKAGAFLAGPISLQSLPSIPPQLPEAEPA